MKDYLGQDIAEGDFVGLIKNHFERHSHGRVDCITTFRYASGKTEKAVKLKDTEDKWFHHLYVSSEIRKLEPEELI